MALRFINTVYERLAGAAAASRAAGWLCSRWPHARVAPPHGDYPPLLDGAEIAEILRQLEALRRETGSRWPVRMRHPGEADSPFVGRGLDFEELRPYAHGDDLRDVDWRAYARSGRAFVRRYREERQAALHIVLDRSASMRFGTRCRLKVVQAARGGVLFALAAMLRGMSVGTTTLGPGGRHLRERAGRAALMCAIEELVAPCPPVVESAPGAHGTFVQQLAEVESLAPAGARLVLLSDFRSLREDDLGVLARLADRHPVVALHVEDESERGLPDLGAVDFTAPGRRKRYSVETGESALRESFAARSTSRREILRGRLEGLGVVFHSCSSCDDVFAWLGPSALYG